MLRRHTEAPKAVLCHVRLCFHVRGDKLGGPQAAVPSIHPSSHQFLKECNSKKMLLSPHQMENKEIGNMKRGNGNSEVGKDSNCNRKFFPGDSSDPSW
jgi:hypothetical protein